MKFNIRIETQVLSSDTTGSTPRNAITRIARILAASRYPMCPSPKTA